MNDTGEKLQLDHSKNSVLNDILFVTCFDPHPLTCVRWGGAPVVVSPMYSRGKKFKKNPNRRGVVF